MIRIGVLSLVIAVFFCVQSSEALEREAGLTRPCPDQLRGLCAEEKQSRRPRPVCGLELTCAGLPAQLAYSQGICFRAHCPGVWGLLHERLDQTSFRRRLIRYRHYAFRGTWELKDEGVIESSTSRQRALFLVLPGDLLEFSLLEPDPCARVVLQELGYVKKGTVTDLQNWLAYRIYQEGGLSNPFPGQ